MDRACQPKKQAELVQPQQRELYAANKADREGIRRALGWGFQKEEWKRAAAGLHKR